MRKALWITVAMLVVYPLSIGPTGLVVMFLTTDQDGWLLQCWQLFYRPLWIVAELTGTHDLLFRYPDWWYTPFHPGNI